MSARGSSAGGSFWTRPLGARKGAGDEATDHPSFQPTLPMVDLLPAAIRESMAVARIRRGLIVAAGAVIAILGVIWLLQGQQIADAEATVAQAEAQTAETQAKIAKLAPVSEVFAQIQGQRELVQQTLAAQPQASEVLNRLRTAASSVDGPPIALSSVSVAYQPLPEAGGVLNQCPNPNPFDDTITIGCLTFGATAASRDQVSQLLRALEADPLFVGPYVAGTTVNGSGPGSVTFTGSAAVSLQGLVTPLTSEQVEAILAPPEPAPGEAPTEGAP